MRIAYFILLLLVLTGCGKVSNNQSVDAESVKEESVADEQVEEQRELTEEDKKYIDLLINENYDSVINETISLKKDNPLKDYYFLAAALKGEFILSNLERVKIVPEELKERVNKLEERAIERSELDKKQKVNDLADKRTDDPGNVSIGMTAEEVLTQGWGRPQEINKTTSASGVKEQWVYPNFNYLYFEDGILVTIQN
ncbi:hypothetical protein H4O14_16735 [Bacillus sp. PAMC26568]|nr:hypothetical protein H4O14_16735 [Bacillus sp. PAMC26568]